MGNIEKERLDFLYRISECLKNIEVEHIVFNDCLLSLIRHGNLNAARNRADLSIEYGTFKNKTKEIIEALDLLQIGRICINSLTKWPCITIKCKDFSYRILVFKYKDKKNLIYRKRNIYPANYLNLTRTINVYGYQLPVPKDSVSFLKEEYGRNWRSLILECRQKSNQIQSRKINVVQNIKCLVISIKYLIKLYFREFPTIEYYLGFGRERLFIYQLINIVRNNTSIEFIEIGSSDLCESVILSQISKGKIFSANIYEASLNTFKKLILIKERKRLKKVRILFSAIVPDKNQYHLREGITPNLNRLSGDINGLSHEKGNNNNNRKYIQFREIPQLENPSSHKLIKMDIEGLEEEIIIKNLDFLCGINNISLIFELHQTKYTNKERFLISLNSLLDNGYKLNFIELSLNCRKTLLDSFKKNNKVLIGHNGRYLIKSPHRSLIKQIVETDYIVLNQAPYFSARNVRSITITKEQ
tara:strand:- start:1728 stop:3143 length:1416 start_codon:yes stop_codon:yes gene_type:complete